MNETTFRWVQNSIIAVVILLYAGSFTAFFRPFLAIKAKRTLRRRAAVVFCIYLAPYLAGLVVDLPNWSSMAFVAAGMILLASPLHLDRGVILLLSAVFFSARNLSALAMESLNFLWSQHLSRLDDVEQIFLHLSLHFLLIMLAQFALFLAVLSLAAGVLHRKELHLGLRETFCLLLIPVAGILVGSILFTMLIGVKDGVIFQLYEQHPLFIVLVPLVAGMFYAGTLVSIFSVQEMTRLQEEKNTYFLEKQQIRAMQERMEEVEGFYTGIRQMKHEMRGHLANIRGLAQSGSYGEMERYIAQMDESMKVFDLTVKTGNPITDVILSDRQRQAAKLGIPFRVNFRYPQSERYNPYDIGIILNNLLQNALESCEQLPAEARYIQLLGRQQKKFFLIEVKNPFEGEIEIDRESQLPRSTKEGPLHGIGLSNVRREVEKYMGEIEIKTGNHTFCTTVLLQERSGLK